MSGDPFAFDYRTANDLVKLLKRTRNGEFAAELDTTSPIDTTSKFVWVYVPATVTTNYDSTVNAHYISNVVHCYPLNIGRNQYNRLGFGKVDSAGVITGGIVCKAYVAVVDRIS